jgi:hypothetical protein
MATVVSLLPKLRERKGSPTPMEIAEFQRNLKKGRYMPKFMKKVVDRVTWFFTKDTHGPCDW